MTVGLAFRDVLPLVLLVVYMFLHNRVSRKYGINRATFNNIEHVSSKDPLVFWSLAIFASMVISTVFVFFSQAGWHPLQAIRLFAKAVDVVISWIVEGCPVIKF